MKEYIALKDTTHNNGLVKAGTVIPSDKDLEKLNPVAFISKENKAKKEAEVKAKIAADKPDAEKLKDALAENQKLQKELAALKAEKKAATPAPAKGKGGKAETKTEPKPEGEEPKGDDPTKPEGGEGISSPEGDNPEGNDPK